MRLLEIIVWYFQNILDYTAQMLPCMLIAMAVFLLLRPLRRKRLRRAALVSGPWREGALLLFVMFAAGLAALTLFPANLWLYVSDRLLKPQLWEMRWEGRGLSDFYPSWDEIAARMGDLPDMLAPFEEIARALRGGPWVFFMMLANIGIFIPVGFFSALLWRAPRWWKSALAGLGSSCAIEFVQFFIGRITDIDDVMLNTAGALAGFWLFCLLKFLFPRWIGKFQCVSKEGDQDE